MWFALCISMKMEKIHKRSQKRSLILESFTSARTLWSVYAKNMMMEWNGTRSHVLHPVSQYCFIRKSIFPMIMASFLQKNLVPILNCISNFQQQSFCFVLACIHQTYSLRFQYCFLRNNSFSNILIDD